MAEFTIPSFLLSHSTDDLHKLMKSVLPVDLDVSEGSHAWNLTRPTALLGAEICEFILPEVIKIIFPEFSYGVYVDYHAKTRGMSRRPAATASGYITITGAPESIIPAGSLFTTVSISDEPAVDYQTLEKTIIPESGTVTIPVQCVKPGVVGNTGKNTVIRVGSRLSFITSVTNEDPITGGTEIEDDETLIERIVEYDRTQGESFVGSVADYKRWATSVPGVGEVAVIPAPDTSGLVTIVVTDSNGDPATDELCTAVYDYIMKPEEEGARLANTNAYLSVIPPETINIGIEAVIELEADSTIEAVQKEFMAKCAEYLPIAMDDGEVKYTKIHKALASVSHANDFSGLKIGVVGSAYSTSNIPISNRQLPRVYVENLNFTAGTV